MPENLREPAPTRIPELEGIDVEDDLPNGDMWVGFASRKRSLAGRPGNLAYAATGSAAGAGVGSGFGAAGRGLVTPAMKRSASLIALSRERQG